MSWNFSTVMTIGDDNEPEDVRGVADALRQRLMDPDQYPDTAAVFFDGGNGGQEVQDQVDVAFEAVQSLIAVIGTAGPWRVALNGHANPGHGKVQGYANDGVYIQVSEV